MMSEFYFVHYKLLDVFNLKQCDAARPYLHVIKLSGLQFKLLQLYLSTRLIHSISNADYSG